MNKKNIQNFFSYDQIIGERDAQEDSLLVASSISDDSELIDLFCLTDGMGGHAAGDVASKIAIEAAVKSFRQSSQIDVSRKLFDTATMANKEIAKKVAKDSSLEGMGCTFILANIMGNKLYWCSVGDSPLWLYRKGKLKQINQDHSMKPILEKMHIDGELTSDQLASDPRRNSLRSCLYGEIIELVDHPSEPLILKKDDFVILASDGVETLNIEEIENIIAKNQDKNPDIITKKILNKVKEKKIKKQDNASLIVIDINKADIFKKFNFLDFIINKIKKPE